MDVVLVSLELRRKGPGFLNGVDDSADLEGATFGSGFAGVDFFSPDGPAFSSGLAGVDFFAPDGPAFSFGGGSGLAAAFVAADFDAGVAFGSDLAGAFGVADLGVEAGLASSLSFLLLEDGPPRLLVEGPPSSSFEESCFCFLAGTEVADGVFDLVLTEEDDFGVPLVSLIRW